MITPPDSTPRSPGQMPAAGYDIQAPYYAGTPDPIYTGGDADAGGRDDVAGTVDAAVASAQARYREHQSDTFGQGSRIGDAVALPRNPLDPGLGSLGATEPAGSYYDPPRDYGGPR